MLHILYNFVSQTTRIAQNIVSRQYCECDYTSMYPPIALNDIKRFVADCFSSSGVTESNAETLAEAIIQADYRGMFSEGVSRLEQYIDEIECRNCDPKATPTVEDEFTSVAVVNGNNGLGPITGKFCMDIAMEKALGSGIGMVAARVK
ncbi:uncharacterized protein LOC108907728 [Anoplophora glabripennis]|uniref:uncharacterized protein LOC108907728 n=1 Tax=Anoplophora glabripennis TaxID=217634 RepID=UPI0008741756|nr:uncharacterized protein LOC108907728 [Anoplophora glabripennis]